MFLEDCCEILDSMRVPITAKDRKKGPYPYYGANGIQDYVSDFIFDDELVLLAEDGGNFGSKERPIAYRVSGKCWVNNHAHVLKPKEGLDVDYLCYSLMFYDTEGLVNGATRQKLTQATMRKMLIPKRDMDEQIKIVEKLKRVVSIKSKREAEIQRLDELIKARFVELFEDGQSPIKTVKEICSEIVDCPHTTPRYEGELKNPAIRTSEIKKGYIAWNSMRYVSDEEYEERVSRLRPEAGDIVYGREGSFGNAAVLPEGYKFCLGQRVMLLRPDYAKCTSEYLLHAVISDDVYRQALGRNNASTVAHVNVKDVKQFKIPLPSLDKQYQFAEFCTQVDKSKVTVQKALDEAQVLFESLMQEYFG
ncbi:MAG: restriction endonuclease subunit S [Eubacteriales bacterium]|nr:restriction endonuclease subunit S [Eubacteriales bacterium]